MTEEGATKRMVHTPYDLGVGIDIGPRKDTDAFFRTLWYSDQCQLIAIFELPNWHDPYLVVQFDLPQVVRVLDEFWLGTEPRHKWEGDLTYFCRTVEGAEYPTDLECVRVTRPNAVLYQFITSLDCVEVISEHPPIARVSSEAGLPAMPTLDRNPAS